MPIRQALPKGKRQSRKAKPYRKEVAEPQGKPYRKEVAEPQGKPYCKEMEPQGVKSGQERSNSYCP